MKRIFILILTFVLFVPSISCGKAAETVNPAYAYFKVFNSVYKQRENLTTGTFLAVNLENTKIKEKDKRIFIGLMESFCTENHYALLIDRDLEKEGYIVGGIFRNGFLFTFNDTELTKNELMISGFIFKSSLGGFGCEYTLKLIDDIWEIEPTGNFWDA